jgi:TrmH family RNA methyltransferase
LYLDEVSDPGNLGTLLRTALAFGWREAVASQGSAEAYASKALLASQGALFGLNFRESSLTPVDDIAWLRRHGYYILSTDLKASFKLSDLTLPKDRKVALVLGNEARGVSPEIVAHSDASVRLEMAGIDSLNVGVAGGILMYELRKQ